MAGGRDPVTGSRYTTNNILRLRVLTENACHVDATEQELRRWPSADICC